MDEMMVNEMMDEMRVQVGALPILIDDLWERETVLSPQVIRAAAAAAAGRAAARPARPEAGGSGLREMTLSLICLVSMRCDFVHELLV